MKPPIITALECLYDGSRALKRPSTIVSFLRHANAVAANSGHDSDRRISEKGKRQCAAMKPLMSEMRFDMVYRSPLPRVWDTLVELDPRTPGFDKIHELVIESGVETHQSRAIDTGYEILGNVGLADILKYKELGRAMDEYAAIALSRLAKGFEDIDSWETAGERINILIAGHGWFCPILAYFLAGTNEHARRSLLYNP